MRGKYQKVFENAEEVFHKYDLDGNGKDYFGR